MNSDNLYSGVYAQREPNDSTCDLFYLTFNSDGTIAKPKTQYYNGTTPWFIYYNLWCNVLDIDTVPEGFYAYMNYADYVYLSQYCLYGSNSEGDTKLRIFIKKVAPNSFDFFQIIKDKKSCDFPENFLADAVEISIPKKGKEVVGQLYADDESIIVLTVNTADNLLKLLLIKNGRIEEFIDVGGPVHGSSYYSYKIFPMNKYKNTYYVPWLELRGSVDDREITPTNLNISFYEIGKGVKTYTIKNDVLSNSRVSAANIGSKLLVAYDQWPSPEWLSKVKELAEQHPGELFTRPKHTEKSKITTLFINLDDLLKQKPVSELSPENAGDASSKPQ